LKVSMNKLIGRNNEIGLIKSYISGIKSFHIYGPEGVGKTAVLEYLYTHWDDLDSPLIPIFCRTSRTLKEILLPIAGVLLQRSRSLANIDKFKRIKEIYRQSDLKEVNSRELKNMIFNNIGYKKFCIILDHLEYVTPKINAFLTPLKDRAVIITASRQSWELTDYQFKGNLNYCLYLFPKLKVANLSRGDAYSLMEYLYENLHLEIPHKAQLFKEIFHITNGNPKMITGILYEVRKPEYIKNQTCNLKLIQLDLMIENPLHK